MVIRDGHGNVRSVSQWSLLLFVGVCLLLSYFANKRNFYLKCLFRRINSKICLFFCVDHSISLYNTYEFDYFQYKNH